MARKLQQVLTIAGALWLLLLVLAALDVAFLNVLAGTGKTILGIISIVTGVIVYFIPTLVAAARQHASISAIFILNLFLGWSFIGWVVALVWAFK